MLILGYRTTNEPNDKEQLKPSVESVDENIRDIDAALVDAGVNSLIIFVGVPGKFLLGKEEEQEKILQYFCT
jgi:hypothetical protein